MTHVRLNHAVIFHANRYIFSELSCKDIAKEFVRFMMQDVVCLAKCRFCPDVHDKQRCDLGVFWVIIGHSHAS